MIKQIFKHSMTNGNKSFGILKSLILKISKKHILTLCQPYKIALTSIFLRKLLPLDQDTTYSWMYYTSAYEETIEPDHYKA